MMNHKHIPRLDILTSLLGAFGVLVFIPGCPIGDITLPGINQAPIANAGANQNVDVGDRVVLSGLGSTDPDDDPLTYTWEQRSGPNVDLDNPNSVQPSFVPAEAATYEFALIVTDGRGGSDEATVRIFVDEVIDPNCPRADAGTDQTVNEGSAVTLRGGNSADPNGNPLSYEWFQLSGPQVSVNGVFTPEPSFTAPQVTGSDIELVFELTVTNQDGCSDTDSVLITVQDRDPDDPCSGVVCDDDGQFCNGVESCDGGVCVSSGNPCQPTETCNETTDSCDECSADSDCDDGNACTTDDCINGNCLNPPVDCDDGLFCNGAEICDPDSGECVDGVDPCAANEICDEETDECGEGCAPGMPPCAVDFEECFDLSLIQHGPGACENTGSEPGPSLEFFSTSLPSTVAPGQQVTFSVDWNRCSDCNPNAVIYSSVIGDWSPASPLYVSSGYFTSCAETANDTVVFTAPSAPGTYRVRWILCYAFDAIRNFCGESAEGDASDPGACPYIEETFEVSPDSGCDNYDTPPCAVDYEECHGLSLIEHGPGACENTGTEPGPSLEFFDTSLPSSVTPGQQVTFSVDWNRCSDCNPNAVIYSSVIGDWSPASPLYVSSGYFTSCAETANDTVVFTAPSAPGTYRVRWIRCYAFDAIRNFCGEHEPGPSSDPGACPFIERTFEVSGTPTSCTDPAGQSCTTDYEVQNNLDLLEHGPGACENTGTEPGPSLEFFDVSLASTVLPGQQVTFSIDWNRCSDCNPNAVVYSSLLGDWVPSSPLYASNGYFTSCSETANDTIVFTAPSQPGMYRVRWILCFAFDAVRHFCGEHAPGPSSDPGACPYVEASFMVCP